MSQRLYATLAEKQHAYRERLKSRTEPGPPPPAPRRKQLSRPRRLQQLEEMVRILAEEYQSWLSALPENLAESQTAEQLELVVEQLEAVADDLGAIEPPRIGR